MKSSELWGLIRNDDKGNPFIVGVKSPFALDDPGMPAISHSRILIEQIKDWIENIAKEEPVIMVRYKEVERL